MSDKDRPSVEIMDEIVARAIRDPGYREKLASDPKATLADAGLSEEELNLVTGGAAFYANMTSVFSDNTALNKIARVAYCTEKGPGPDDVAINPLGRNSSK